MKKSSGPIREFPLAEHALREQRDFEQRELPDFSNTENTFRHLSDRALLANRRLFKLMGMQWLTRIMGSAGVAAVRWHLPGAKWMVKNTIYRQFVGGTSLVAAQDSIEVLAGRGVTSILDYGAEAKQDREELDKSMKEILRAIDFSAQTEAAIGAVVKVSSLLPFATLEKYNDRELDLIGPQDPEVIAGLKRLDAVCNRARTKNCRLYIDAEESWIQHSIDRLAELMMSRYNTDAHIVYTTCQLYRHDRLDYLRAAHRRATEGGYLIGVKVVRGAYMNKERARAAELGYSSPIQPDIQATHRDFNAAIVYCLDNLDTIACCLGSHNEESVVRAVTEMRERRVRRDHPNFHFSQLLGMSGNLSFNLAEGGYNVCKYMVYGPVGDVLPYLVRRAQENTSVTGETSRELKLIDEEIKRRGLAG